MLKPDEYGRLAAEAMDYMPKGRRDRRLQRWMRDIAAFVTDVQTLTRNVELPHSLSVAVTSLDREARLSHGDQVEALSSYYTERPGSNFFAQIPPEHLARREMLRMQHQVTDQDIYLAGLEALEATH